MFYYIIFLLLSPLLLLLSPFRKNKTHKNLIIQTAKIGDYVNTSIMFDALEKTDLIIDKINSSFAFNDSRIKNIYFINDYKNSFYMKLKLSFIIFRNNYEHIYIVMPNSLNLFIGKMSFSKNQVTLSTYTKKWYIKILSFTMKKVKHTINDLTLDSYLKLIDSKYTHKNFNRIIQLPIVESKYKFIDKDKFNIGISLTAGNKLKTIDIETWIKIFNIIEKLNPIIFIFGVESEKEEFNKLNNIYNFNKLNIISLLGEIPLAELPSTISKMNLYISSDTGNSYIADTFNIPLINFAGPCYMEEQRPIGKNALIIKSNSANVPFSFIFKAPYLGDTKDLYTINKTQEVQIEKFILKNYKDFQSN